MARKQLFTLDLPDDYDFLLAGIFCSYRDYRLCFELNRSLELEFERKDDLELKADKKGSGGVFPVFCAVTSDDEYYFIIGNKGNKGVFAPEMKQVDYFLMIRNASRYSDIHKIAGKIRNITIVSSVIEIDPPQLKSAENFLLVEPA